MLLEHLDGILNYCRTKVPLGVVEAVNGNIKSLLRRGRGYQNLRYLLLKAQRIAVTNTEFVSSGKRPKMRVPSNSCGEPYFVRASMVIIFLFFDIKSGSTMKRRH
jgi:hypothetical protein